jgi:hypothetical protein
VADAHYTVPLWNMDLRAAKEQVADLESIFNGMVHSTTHEGLHGGNDACGGPEAWINSLRWRICDVRRFDEPKSDHPQSFSHKIYLIFDTAVHLLQQRLHEHREQPFPKSEEWYRVFLYFRNSMSRFAGRDGLYERAYFWELLAIRSMGGTRFMNPHHAPPICNSILLPFPEAYVLWQGSVTDRKEGGRVGPYPQKCGPFVDDGTKWVPPALASAPASKEYHKDTIKYVIEQDLYLGRASDYVEPRPPPTERWGHLALGGITSQSEIHGDPSESDRRPMEIPGTSGNSCSPTESHGVPQRPTETHGDHWNLPEPHGVPRRFYGVPREFRKFQRFPEPPEPHGDSRSLIGASSESSLRPMEPHGD